MFKRSYISAFTTLLGFTLLLPCAAGAGAVWYVDDDAPSDPGPGNPAISDPAEDGSIAHPFDAIQEAIAAALDGDAVIVAQGTYQGVGNRDIDFGGKAITISSTDPLDPATVAATIVDCENAGRGFIFQSGETATSVLDGLTIIDGAADRGAGIRCTSASGPTILRCVISNNVATVSGGGVGVNNLPNESSAITLMDCTVTGNEGGGISTVSSSVTITNCEITDNAGGGIDMLYGDACVVSVTTIADNDGAGLLANQTVAVDVSNCAIVGNVSVDGAGGVRTTSTDSVRIHNSLIADNQGVHGGGIHHGPSFGDFELSNCTLSGNVATQTGGGLRVGAADAVAINSILWNNSAPDGPELLLSSGFNHAATVSVDYGVVEGGSAAAEIQSEAGATSQLTWGFGNIESSPLFVDPGAGDYHLAPGSPAINAGDPAFVADVGETDLDGDPRVVGQYVDIGSDEFRIAADLDADCDVDLTDLAQLLASYGLTGGATPEDGDLDGDGDVDLSDLAALLGEYGASCD